MSNVGSWLSHMRVQASHCRKEFRAWRQSRTILTTIRYTLLSPMLAAIVLILLATFFNASGNSAHPGFNNRTQIENAAAILSHRFDVWPDADSGCRWLCVRSLTWLMVIYADQHESTGYAPLPDRLHDLMPQNDNYSLPDTILVVWAVVSIVRFAFWWNGMTMRRFLALVQRFIFLEALVQILRGLFLGATAYPSPDPTCIKDPDGNYWDETWRRISGDRKTCSDSMFSGHTGMYHLLALFWFFYSQGEEFNVFLPRSWHARDYAAQDERAGVTRLTADEIAAANPREGLPLSSGGHERNTAINTAPTPTPAPHSVAGGHEYVSFSSASPLNWPPPRTRYHLIDLIILAVVVLAPLASVWARHHYTADVFVGTVVGQALFRIYHLALENFGRKRRLRLIYGYPLDGNRNLKPVRPSLVTASDSSLLIGFDGNPAALRYTIWERFLSWFEQGVLVPEEEIVAQLKSTGAVPFEHAFPGEVERTKGVRLQSLQTEKDIEAQRKEDFEV